MPTRILLKLMIPFGLLAVVFLATQIVSSKSPTAAPKEVTVVENSIAGPVIVDRLTASRKSNNLVGSDWIERHPSNYFAGSDYFERHPMVNTMANLAGSDWIERHPSSYYAGSDYIERHPTTVTIKKFTAGSDWVERHR